MNTNLFFSNIFGHLRDIPKSRGYPDSKVWFPALRKTYRTFWPKNLHFSRPFPAFSKCYEFSREFAFGILQKFRGLRIETIKVSFSVKLLAVRTPGISRQNPGISAPKSFGFPGFRRTYLNLWISDGPRPRSRGRPPPYLKDSPDQNALGLGSFFSSLKVGCFLPISALAKRHRAIPWVGQSYYRVPPSRNQILGGSQTRPGISQPLRRFPLSQL